MRLILFWNFPVQVFAGALAPAQHSSKNDQPLEQKSEAESWEIKVDETEASGPQFCSNARHALCAVIFNGPLEIGIHQLQQILLGPDSVRGPPGC